MSDILAKLKEAVQAGAGDRQLLEAALQEITGLRQRRDALEEILIVLVRTGFPWDEDGTPNERMPAFEERYMRLLHEASDLLGLDVRSTLTRTEPKT